jgi:pantoate--beta-alanine ligase
LACPDVVAVRDPDTLAPVASVQAGPILVALFVRLGSTRLLDNRVIGRERTDKREAAQ